MEELRSSLERVVSAGIRAYIGLLCAGEQERSRRVLSDTMQLSSLGAGGPSQRVRVSLFAGEAGSGTARESEVAGSSRARVLAFFTLRSLLASLLVLRASAYWRRVPELAELQEACARFNRCLGSRTEDDDGSEAGARRAYAGSPWSPRVPDGLTAEAVEIKEESRR